MENDVWMEPMHFTVESGQARYGGEVLSSRQVVRVSHSPEQGWLHLKGAARFTQPLCDSGDGLAGGYPQ